MTKVQPLERLVIQGGRPLYGQVNISAGKNSALAILAASLLSDEVCTIEHVPDIFDLRLLCRIMGELGAKVTFDEDRIIVDPRGIHTHSALFEDMTRMRASYYVMPPLLARFGKAEIALPGGCNIGERPIDMHVKGLSALGAKVTEDHEASRLVVDAPVGMVGTEVFLDVYSVGATINIMMAAAKTPGTTTIVNAAKEPHVVDVANFINSMGGYVRGAGTYVMRIRGVPYLRGCTYAPIPDQIETGTLMIAAAATSGDVTIRNAIPAHMEALSAKLLEVGARVEEGDDVIRVSAKGRLRSAAIKTLPYPGFPTDLQQPMTALLTLAKGTSVVTENIYEARFRYVEELAKMGAQVQMEQYNIARVEGVPQLTGAHVAASDLRAGAALIVAGLAARGTTIIDNIHYVDRGYEHIEQKLLALGADIRRESL